MKEEILNQIIQVRDLNIKDLVPIKIDGVIIEIIDNKKQLHLPLNMNGEKLFNWRKRSGGVFYKDLSLYLKGYSHGKYIKATGENILLIFRIIEENEINEFQKKRLIYGKLKDKYVMLLKDLLKKDNEEMDYEYINNMGLDEFIDSEEKEIRENLNIPLDKEEGNSGQNSLFLD